MASRIVNPDEGIDADYLTLVRSYRVAIEPSVLRRIEAEESYPLADPPDCIRVLARSDFSLSGATPSSQLIALANGIDSHDWVSGTLVVRVYSQTTWASGSTVSVLVTNVFIDQDNPALTVSAPSATTTLTIGAVAAPAYFTTALSVPIGAQLSVALKASVGDTSGQVFTLGIDLVGYK